MVAERAAAAAAPFITIRCPNTAHSRGHGTGAFIDIVRRAGDLLQRETAAAASRWKVRIARAGAWMERRTAGR